MKKSCINAKKITIEKDLLYGNYLTIEEVICNGKKSIERRWKVKHILTNKIFIMRPSYLSKIDLKFKEKLINNDYQKGLKNYLYNDYKRNSIIRGHDFKLTLKEFCTIINQNCHYCGDKPEKSSDKIILTRGNSNEPSLYYNGIDRKNSDDGYNNDNCVPCCSKCNYMKHIQTVDNFMKQIEKIYNHSINKLSHSKGES